MAADDEILRSSLDVHIEQRESKRKTASPITPYQQEIIERLSRDINSLEQRIRYLLADMRDPLCHRQIETDRYGGFFECKRPYGHDGPCGDLWHMSEEERKRALRR